MCIIVHKPKGVELPIDIMENCFLSNPDGAGFVHRTKDNLMQIQKGYMKFNDLVTSMKYQGFMDEEKEVIKKKFDMVLHFRISTVGSTSPGNCHPYPVSKSINELKELCLKSEMAIAHNGTIRKYSRYGKDKNKKDLSDTQSFIMDILARPVVMENLHDRGIQKLITEYIDSSRLCIMTGDRVYKIGSWTQDKGVSYSNEGFRCVYGIYSNAWNYGYSGSSDAEHWYYGGSRNNNRSNVNRTKNTRFTKNTPIKKKNRKNKKESATVKKEIIVKPENNSFPFIYIDDIDFYEDEFYACPDQKCLSTSLRKTTDGFQCLSCKKFHKECEMETFPAKNIVNFKEELVESLNMEIPDENYKITKKQFIEEAHPDYNKEK